MAVSPFSTSTPGYLRYPSPESLLLKTVRLPLRHQCSESIALDRKHSHVSQRQTKYPTKKANRMKVSCCQKRGIPILEASRMDEIYDILAERVLPSGAVASNPSSKHIVGLAGPPGAGKSMLASKVVQRVNKLWAQKSCSFDSHVKPQDVAVVIPMDGFHLYRSQLDAMEDPEEAHARRGAPWTFAPTLLLKCLKILKNEEYVYAPSFDHHVGDPVEENIFVSIQ
uniref:Uncharacterized protein MANES_05G084500 n=1 Tax=Rhizophora mucronata TaxID=61149 RepID=A0A2P2JBS7_RHIMU